MADGYNHTDNFNLPLYKDNTPADFRDGYNTAMHTIDNNMLNISTVANKANANLTALGADTPEKAGALATDIANGNTAHHLLTYMGITDENSAGEHINAIEQNHTDTQNNTNALTALNAETVDKANALSTLINQTSQSTQTNTNALTSLGAETPTKATTLHNRIYDTYTKHESDTRYVPAKREVLVTFGDSYADATAERSWAIQLAHQNNYELHNYAIGGAGYIAPNTTYASEFQTAKNDTTYDHNSVTLVIVGGSRNSNDGYKGTIKTASISLLTDIKREYPNARIISVPMLWDASPISGYWRYNAGQVYESAVETNTEYIPWAWTWNLGNTNYFPPKDIHPNATGTNVIVYYLRRYLEGNYNGRTCAAVIRHPTNPAAYCVTINASGGTISYGFQCQSGVTPTELLVIPGVPAWATPDIDTTNSGYCWTTAISNGANDTVLFKINTDGTCGWQGFTTESGTPNGLAGVQFTRAW